MWDFSSTTPNPGMDPISPALEGEVLITVPPWKSQTINIARSILEKMEGCYRNEEKGVNVTNVTWKVRKAETQGMSQDSGIWERGQECQVAGTTYGTSPSLESGEHAQVMESAINCG